MTNNKLDARVHCQILKAQILICSVNLHTLPRGEADSLRFQVKLTPSASLAMEQRISRAGFRNIYLQHLVQRAEFEAHLKEAVIPIGYEVRSKNFYFYL